MCVCSINSCFVGTALCLSACYTFDSGRASSLCVEGLSPAACTPVTCLGLEDYRRREIAADIVRLCAAAGFNAEDRQASRRKTAKTEPMF